MISDAEPVSIRLDDHAGERTTQSDSRRSAAAADESERTGSVKPRTPTTRFAHTSKSTFLCLKSTNTLCKTFSALVLHRGGPVCTYCISTYTRVEDSTQAQGVAISQTAWSPEEFEMPAWATQDARVPRRGAAGCGICRRH